MIQMEVIMVNIVAQMYAYEDNIFESIATFIKNVTGLPVWLKDKPFIAPTGNNPYITIRMITSSNSNGMGQYYNTQEDGSAQYIIDNAYQVEIMSFNGRPFPVLNYLLGAFSSFTERLYQDLYVNGVSFLSSSNVSEANSVLDGDKTLLAARMIVTFNTRMIIEDSPTNEITGVKYSLNSYPDSYENPDPLKTEGTFNYVTS